jgi:hypothetical protein
VPLHTRLLTRLRDVEVKIGVTYAARELVIESAQSSEEVASIVAAALQDGSVLNLEDEKGRRVIVPVEKLAYVEIAEPEARRVGFGAI